MNRNELEQLAGKVLDAAFEVHRHLGAGLLENAYEMAFCHELAQLGIAFERQKPISVFYKNVQLDCGYRADVLVAGEIFVELKSCDQLLPIHEAQVLNYLKLADKRIGFLINFNVRLLKTGLKRIVNQLTDDDNAKSFFKSSRPSRSSRFNL